MSARCRSCGGTELETFLSLGETPLANALETPGAGAPRTYPLDVAFCAGCTLVQLTESVSPDVLFTDYPYFSSDSDTMVAHARGLAEEMVRARGLGPDSLVVEVASNDGYLLETYRRAAIPVLGVEPARNVAQVAIARGIPTECAFFGTALAARLAAQGKRADVIHAHNVLAHVPDPNDLVRGIAALLEPEGVAVLEVPYVRDLVERVEFDTIYHEHLCYFSASSLSALFGRNGLAIERLERVPIHGGSLRAIARPGAATEPELTAREREEGYASAEVYRTFSGRVAELMRALRELLAGLKSRGGRIAAYGAAAKGSTLLNTCRIGRETLDFVADRSPHKQGKCMPGARIPIVPPARILEEMPDYLLVLCWNLAEEVLAQQAEYRQRGGRFILPVPRPTVV